MVPDIIFQGGRIPQDLIFVDEPLVQSIAVIPSSDGTSDEFPLKFPSGSGNNPGFAGGGMEPPVKDIRAGENVEVTEKNGIYTVSSTGRGDSDETGLPYYFISSTDSVIVPLYRQHLTLGDVTVEGEFIINGEQVIL